MKKSEIAQNKHSAKIHKFKQSLELRTKREVLSMDEEDSEQGDPDGHFLSLKTMKILQRGTVLSANFVRRSFVTETSCETIIPSITWSSILVYSVTGFSAL